MPRNHDLPRSIQVGRRHDAAGNGRRRVVARLLHARGVEPEDRSHRALADRHRLLHVPPAPAHRPQGIREG
jgi:hypothetical protein